MRGHPLWEWGLLLCVGLLLAVPIGLVTRRVPDPVAPRTVPSGEVNREMAWVDLRFGQTPESVEVAQGGEVLHLGGGRRREDFDAEVVVISGELLLRVRVEWGEDVGESYAEVSVEPDGRAQRVQGFWSRGETERMLEFTW